MRFAWLGWSERSTNDLHVQLVVKKEVLHLEVSMQAGQIQHQCTNEVACSWASSHIPVDDAVAMDGVEGRDQLPHKLAHLFLRKTPMRNNVVEDLAALGKLGDEIVRVGGLDDLIELDDVRMLQLPHEPALAV
jgi:hypothetical protein